MIDTSRIRTGFDVEVQLAGGWFRVALQGLAGAGQLFPDGPPPPFPPDAEIQINAVTVIFDPPDRDLRVDLTIGGIPVVVLATLELSDSGDELTITTNIPGVEFTVPFDVLDDLAGPPTLAKVRGENGNAPAMTLLANLDLRTSPQNQQPLPEGQHEPRGEPLLAQSFLPPDKDMAVGIGQATFARFANDAWHTQLRADDGSHPFPDDENEQGAWESVSISPQSGRIRATLVATIPLDSPWIDVIPDATVTLEIDMTPSLVAGNLVFSISVDTDIDTGILGDLFAFVTGGLIGLVIGFLAGGPFIGAGIGAVLGVIVLEVAEVVVEGIVQRKIVAELEGEPPPAPILTCQDDVVVEASAHVDDDDGGLVLGPTQAIPRSIPIHTDQPDDLYERTLLVTANFDELQMDSTGLAMAGPVAVAERFQPLPAVLVGRTRAPTNGGQPAPLATLIYRLEDGSTAEVAAADAFQRMEDAELAPPPPIKLRGLPAEADFRIPEGRLPTTCLSATNIRRKRTVITEILFSTGVDLAVSEAVALQDAGAIVVRGLQLIHPKNANPYFRAFPDGSIDNNLESLPGF